MGWGGGGEVPPPATCLQMASGGPGGPKRWGENRHRSLQNRPGHPGSGAQGRPARRRKRYRGANLSSGPASVNTQLSMRCWRGLSSARMRVPEGKGEGAAAPPQCACASVGAGVGVQRIQRGRLRRYQVRVPPRQWFWRDAVGLGGREECQCAGLSES